MTAARRKGTTEQAFDRALTAARAAGRLGPEDGALVAAGRASAALVDDARRSEDPKAGWLVVAALRAHTELLRELELTPGTRPADPATDPLQQALKAILDSTAQDPYPTTDIDVVRPPLPATG